jgi:hypothetical protein
MKSFFSGTEEGAAVFGVADIRDGGSVGDAQFNGSRPR